MKIWTIYVRTCTVNGKEYVGMTSTTIQDRLSTGYSGQVIGKALDKYGAKAWVHKSLAFTNSSEEALNLECEFIQVRNTLVPSGYNVAPRSNLSPMEFEEHRANATSERVKKIQSKWAMEFFKDAARAEKRNQKLRKIASSEEYRKRQSETAKEIFNTAEHRKARAEKAKELWADPKFRERMMSSRGEEYKAKLSVALKKAHETNAETYKPAREALKSKWESEEYRAKMVEVGKAAKGVKRSEETKQKMREAAKARWQRQRGNS